MLAPSVTPPLTSPTSSVMAYPPVLSQTAAVASTPSASDVTSILDDCDLESLLSLDWSPPPINLKPKKEPPGKLRPEGGPPVSLQHRAGYSANMTGEKGPLTEFLTSGVLPHVRDDAGLMHLGAVAELLQSMSTDSKEKVVMSVLQNGNTAGPQPVVAGPSMMMQSVDLIDCSTYNNRGFRPLEPLQDTLELLQHDRSREPLQDTLELLQHDCSREPLQDTLELLQHHCSWEPLQDYHIECRILLTSCSNQNLDR